MRNFQDGFETSKRSFINGFSIRMTVPLKLKFHFERLFCDWLGHWKKSFCLKHVAASFKRVTAFSNMQEHGEISTIHFTFIVILFLPCLF